MKYSFRGMRVLLFVLTAILFSPFALADAVDDVMKVVHEWAALENDLEAQADLIRDDRIQIFEMIRQTDQAQNLRIQLAQQKSRDAVDSGGSVIVTIESPIARIYGNTAVVSFVRLFNVLPGNAAPGPASTAFMTLVLVKEGQDWQIAHLHGSTN